MSGWTAFAALLIVIGALAGAPGLILVAVATVAYRSITRLWVRYGTARVSYERRLEAPRAVAGDRLTLDVTIWNRKALPLPWVSADDLVSDGLAIRERPTLDRHEELFERRVFHNAWSLAWYERVVRHFHLDDLRRGTYHFGPVQLRIRDMLGREAAGSDLEVPATLVVGPRTVPLRRQRSDTAPIGERRARQSLHTDPALYAGVRPFQRGDPIRRIHWRATARMGAPVSRRYEPARGREAIVAIDVQTLDVPFWQMVYDADAFEGLCVAAGSLARELLSDGTAVGLAAPSFTGTQQRYAWLAPRAAVGQLPLVADLLARIGPVSSSPFDGLLTWLTRRVGPGAAVIVLSARDPGTYLAAMRRMARSGYQVQLASHGPQAADHASLARGAGLPAVVAELTPDWQRAEHLVLAH